MSPVFTPFAPDLIYFGSLDTTLLDQFPDPYCEMRRYEDIVPALIQEPGAIDRLSDYEIRQSGIEIVPYLEDILGLYNGHNSFGHRFYKGRPVPKFAIKNRVPNYLVRVESPFEDDYYSHYFIGHQFTDCYPLDQNTHIRTSGSIMNLDHQKAEDDHYEMEARMEEMGIDEELAMALESDQKTWDEKFKK